MEQKLGRLEDGTALVLPSNLQIIEQMNDLDDQQIQSLEGRHAVRYVSAQIVAKMNHPDLIETYVYSFPQSGKTIIDLSFKGVMAVAQWWGNLNIIRYSKEERENSILVEIHARDTLTNLDAIAAFEQSKLDELGKPDKFAYPKAYSKALRDVYKKLIPIEIFAKMAKLFLERKETNQIDIAKTTILGILNRLGYEPSVLSKLTQHKFNKDPDTLTLIEYQQIRSLLASKPGEALLQSLETK